ncbi:MAG: glycosyltransferase [Lachnospiraceae bacterium]|nr:glycosyltransferase [Lachnospiraceae bacterium]
MKDLFLSVIVPVYNAGEYLKECLDCLAAQTFRDMEIILVDDGSTDGSGEVCDAYAAEHPQFRVIHKENGGPASAKREGLKIAQGEYIGFADSDDRMDADYYEALVNHAKQSGADIVTCGVYEEAQNRVITDGVPAGVYRGESLEQMRNSVIYDIKYETEGILPSSFSKIYKKETIQPFLSVVPDGLYLWEDLCYVYPPFFIASCVQITHGSGYRYYTHPASVTHKADSGRWEKILRAVSAARANYAGFSREVRLAFCVRCTYIFSAYLWDMCLRGKGEYAGVRDAAKLLRDETENGVFRQITEMALKSGRIRNRINRRFLGSIMSRHYAAAVLYCRCRMAVSRAVRTFKGRGTGKQR